MKKEEAIKTLRELWRETNDTWYEEAYDMAIEALENEPSYKTKEQIQENCIGVVYTTEEFNDAVNRGIFNRMDGEGILHDGKEETNISVWNVGKRTYWEYPYVCWYNK